ncbi:MAG: 50S ribosomal protein L22 [Candidatus Paceibacterota bacterium]
MEAKATLKTYRQSPRKVRSLAKEIVGRTVEDAKARLSLEPKRVSPVLLKLLRSAEANAYNKNMEEGLKISRLWVDEGPTLFRMMPRAHGRAFVIRKRTSHINIVLTQKETNEGNEKVEDDLSGKEVKSKKEKKASRS